MFDQIDSPGSDPMSGDALDALEDLQRNSADEIRRQRSHERLKVKTKVLVQPGNASELLKFKVQGTTGDISVGGCRLLTPVPISVGDIYRLTFDPSQLNIPLTFARCVQCHLIREDAFEAGFAFFNQVELSTVEVSGGQHGPPTGTAD